MHCDGDAATMTSHRLEHPTVRGREHRLLLHSVFFVNFLFRKLAEIIKGTRFEDLEGIKTTVTTELRSMPEDIILSAMRVSFIL